MAKKAKTAAVAATPELRRRVERVRFRRDPDAYRRDLEAKLIQASLPPEKKSPATRLPESPDRTG